MTPLVKRLHEALRLRSALFDDQPAAHEGRLSHPGIGVLLDDWPAVAQGWMPEKPPAEFAKPYVGRLNVVWVPLRKIPEHCQGLKQAYACAYHNSTTCTLYIPDNVPSAMMLKLYVHELAHCNGWKHPQPPLPLAKPN